MTPVFIIKSIETNCYGIGCLVQSNLNGFADCIVLGTVYSTDFSITLIFIVSSITAEDTESTFRKILFFGIGCSRHKGKKRIVPRCFFYACRSTTIISVSIVRLVNHISKRIFITNRHSLKFYGVFFLGYLNSFMPGFFMSMIPDNTFTVLVPLFIAIRRPTIMPLRVVRIIGVIIKIKNYSIFFSIISSELRRISTEHNGAILDGQVQRCFGTDFVAVIVLHGQLHIHAVQRQSAFIMLQRSLAGHVQRHIALSIHGNRKNLRIATIPGSTPKISGVVHGQYCIVLLSIHNGFQALPGIFLQRDLVAAVCFSVRSGI